MKKTLILLAFSFVFPLYSHAADLVACAPGDLFNVFTGDACSDNQAPLACQTGDLFDIYTGKSCADEATISNLQTQVQTLSNKVDTVIQNTTPIAGSVEQPPVVVTPTISLGAQECLVEPKLTGTTSVASVFPIVTTGSYYEGELQISGTDNEGNSFNTDKEHWPSYVTPNYPHGIPAGTYSVTENLYDSSNFKQSPSTVYGTPEATNFQQITVTDCN